MNRRDLLKLLSLVWMPFVPGFADRNNEIKTLAKPRLQCGVVSGTLSEIGNTIIQVDYDFDEVPRLTASPTGQGDLIVTSFEANALTHTTGAIAVKGEPHAAVSFTWMACSV